MAVNMDRGGAFGKPCPVGRIPEAFDEVAVFSDGRGSTHGDVASVADERQADVRTGRQLGNFCVPW